VSKTDEAEDVEDEKTRSHIQRWSRRIRKIVKVKHCTDKEFTLITPTPPLLSWRSTACKRTTIGTNNVTPLFYPTLENRGTALLLNAVKVAPGIV